MNNCTPRISLSAAVVSQLAKKAATIVKDVGYHPQGDKSELLATEQIEQEFKGWAMGGWEILSDPHYLPGY